MKSSFVRLPGGDGYSMDLHEFMTELRIERLHRERGGELVGELALLSAMPGVRAVNGIVHVANFNVSSDRTRNERAKIYGERLKANGSIDVALVLEEFCQRVLAMERTGVPAVLLRDIPPARRDEDIEVDRGVRLLKRHPIILFGDGGDAKSYLGLYWAARLASKGHRVLYADWEFAGEDHRERLQRIAGDKMPELWYLRCERPLVHEVDRIIRTVAENDIDYWVGDSIVFACDGPPESAETAGAYFRAVRRIGLGSLHIAHTTKGENADQKPFGSTFWHNGARATWYIKRSESGSDSEIAVGLYNRKASLNARSKPLGYRIEFGAERTRFERIELMDVQDLAAKVSVAARVAHLLGGIGQLSIAEIASELDLSIDTVSKAVRRGTGKRFTYTSRTHGSHLVGLLSEAVQ